MTTNLEYRDSLREQLRLVAPHALHMLAGDAPFDPVVLLAALQSAALLDPTTAGEPALRELRASVLAAARGSRLMGELPGVMKLEPAPWPDPGQAEREERLHQLVSLAAIQPMLPLAARERIQENLDHALAMIASDPRPFQDITASAAWLSDQLDLEPGTPVACFLSEIRFFEQPPVLSNVAWDRAMARARAELLPSPVQRLLDILRAWWGPGVSLSAEPVRLAAQGDEPALEPTRRLVLRQDAQAQEELNLLTIGDCLVLEWYGAARPECATLEPGSVALQAIQDPMLARFRLPTTLPEQPPRVILTFADGRRLEHDLGLQPLD